MADAITVGIDIGTTSVKAVAADADGNIVARARVTHELRSPQPGRLEHDAVAAWRDGPIAALSELRDQLHDAPAAVVVTSMVPSLCAVDEDGTPLTPGLLYGDERGRPLNPAAPPGLSGEAVGFLGWLAEQAPQAAGFWPAQAVANRALCGEGAVDMASVAALGPVFTGLGWSDEHLDVAGVSPGQMPRVAGLGEAIGTMDDGCIVGSGLVDALGEQLVSGACEPGDVLVMCGTTLLTWAVTSAYQQADPLWVMPNPAAPTTFMVGGPSNAGGMFVDWFRDLMGGAEPDDSDPHSLPVWAPYPQGERTPLHDPARRATLHRLDRRHGPAQIVRAGYEAVAFVVRHHLDLARDLAGAEPTRIVATGGGTRSEVWMQSLADVTGLEVHVAEISEGGALGAAWVARLAAGLETEFSGAGRWARTSHVVVPRTAWTEAAEQRYSDFRELTDGRLP